MINDVTWEKLPLWYLSSASVFVDRGETRIICVARCRIGVTEILSHPQTSLSLTHTHLFQQWWGSCDVPVDFFASVVYNNFNFHFICCHLFFYERDIEFYASAKWTGCPVKNIFKKAADHFMFTNTNWGCFQHSRSHRYHLDHNSVNDWAPGHWPPKTRIRCYVQDTSRDNCLFSRTYLTTWTSTSKQGIHKILCVGMFSHICPSNVVQKAKINWKYKRGSERRVIWSHCRSTDGFYYDWKKIKALSFSGSSCLCI